MWKREPEWAFAPARISCRRGRSSTPRCPPVRRTGNSIMPRWPRRRTISSNVPGPATGATATGVGGMIGAVIGAGCVSGAGAVALAWWWNRFPMSAKRAAMAPPVDGLDSSCPAIPTTLSSAVVLVRPAMSVMIGMSAAKSLVGSDVVSVMGFPLGYFQFRRTPMRRPFRSPSSVRVVWPVSIPAPPTWTKAFPLRLGRSRRGAWPRASARSGAASPGPG